MKKAENEGGLLIEPLLTRPDNVAIVCLGRSSQSYIVESASFEGKHVFDEVWTLNRGFRGYHHDKLFVMDDLRWLEKHKSKKYADFLKKHDKPIITSTVYPEYPMSIAYPFGEVFEDLGNDDIFSHNTVSYMVAYAMYIRVKCITVYGADFIYPNGNFAESGGQAVAYLLGMCRHFGIHHRIPQQSTLLYSHSVKQHPDGSIRRARYGYHRIDEMNEAAAKEKKRKKEQRKGK